MLLNVNYKPLSVQDMKTTESEIAVQVFQWNLR